MKVVVSIGGSVLAPDLDPDQVAAHAAVVDALVDAGCEVGIVTGGGGVAREYIGTARELDANEVLLDQLGIDVTRINARLLIAALETPVETAPPHEYERAGAALRRDGAVVMGGITPGQTTDAVAAALAESIDADVLVFATSVDGVYSADPRTDDDAEKFETLTPTELVDVIAPMSRDAGASAPVDLLAAKLLERAKMRAMVLDATDPESIERAVLDGHHDGTDIVPSGSEEPDAWT